MELPILCSAPCWRGKSLGFGHEANYFNRTSLTFVLDDVDLAQEETQSLHRGQLERKWSKY